MLRNGKPGEGALKAFIFDTKEAALPPPLPFVVSPAPAPAPASTPTASLISETQPTLLTPITPEASEPEPQPVPVQSKETNLTHRLQAPDTEATIRLTVDMSVGRVPQIVDVGGKDRAQESGYCADAVGGWIERGGWVGVIGL